MTAEELYEFGVTSEPARMCIPKELVQSLPRLERIRGRLVVQYWYYFQNVSYPACPDNPWYYAAFDIAENTLVEMQAFTDRHVFPQSWLDMVTYSSQMREVKYLEYCVSLLNRGNITEEEITRSQAMWLDAQAKDTFCWLYWHSGIRPQAVEMLLRPGLAEKSRYLLKLWGRESVKYLMKREKGYEKLEKIWNDPELQEERDIYSQLQDKGPVKGIRSRWEW